MPDEPFEEASKATRAVAKTASKALDLVRGVGGFLNSVFGRAIVNTIDLKWTDRVETRRIRAAIYDYKELARLWIAVEKELAEARVKGTKRLPAKVAIPLLESATMENEPRLRALWAKLLASGLAGEKIEATYVRALSAMTGRDAKVLQEMFRAREKDPEPKEWTSGPVTFERGLDVRSADLGTAHKLFSYGIVATTHVVLKVYAPPRHHDRYGAVDGSQEEALVTGDMTVVRFTEFGKRFCQALGMPNKARRSKKTPKRGSPVS
jgi:hypothetical protein